MTICYNNYFVIILDITNILKETPDEDQLFDLLYNIRDKWNEIGLALHVHCNILTDLKHLNYSDTFRLLNVINICITQPSPITWEMVITAMENPIVNNKGKADLKCHYLSAGKSNKLLIHLKVKLIIIQFSHEVIAYDRLYY